jgi:hypothetical protein
MSGPGFPTLAGFGAFITNVMAIDPLLLPSDSPVIGYAFQAALGIVNPVLLSVCLPAVVGGPPASTVFALAVYNLAGSQLLQFAQDQPERTFFAETRTSLGLDKFSPGVVSSFADSTTSTALLNPEFMKNLTLQNLQNLRDPYGRQALAFMQDYGPTIWASS